MTTNFNIVRTGSIALIAFVLLALPMAFAHAADLGDDGYSYDYSYPVDSGYSYDYSYPVDSGYSYDYSYPTDSYYNDYGYGSGYMGSSYLGGGFMGGSSYLPSRPSLSNSNTNINENYCTNGSCNTAINAPTTVTVTNPSPVVYNYPNNNYPTCNTCGCYGYAACYHPPVVYQNPPIAYNQTPYIALSAVPYTGLDLGFWGTVFYWGFLILWCLVAAYLVVVKKVQNRILRSLNSFLFGDSATSHEVAVAAPVAPVLAYSAPAAPVKVDAIDDFILSQINRVRA